MIYINVVKEFKNSDQRFVLDCRETFASHEISALYGHSGSGKTSLLRIIAGLETPDTGKVIVNNSVWFDSNKQINLRPQERKIGLVFQDYLLFPHMSVVENIAYASNSKDLVDELLDVMDIRGLKNAPVGKLSGGQKQRVSLARALAREPELLILDEPFSALDQNLKNKLHDELERIHDLYNPTILLVSHDNYEILRLASKTVIMEQGRIVESGNPLEIFQFQASIINKRGAFCSSRMIDNNQRDINYGQA